MSPAFIQMNMVIIYNVILTTSTSLNTIIIITTSLDEGLAGLSKLINPDL